MLAALAFDLWVRARPATHIGVRTPWIQVTHQCRVNPGFLGGHAGVDVFWVNLGVLGLIWGWASVPLRLACLLNLWDRATRGHVRDYICTATAWGSFTCNIADLIIGLELLKQMI